MYNETEVSQCLQLSMLIKFQLPYSHIWIHATLSNFGQDKDNTFSF